MRRTLQLVSAAALAATLVPSVLFFRGAIPLESAQLWMLAGTVAWFAATPAWMGRR
jgi:branched-subunit amino acid transport protein